MKKSALFTLDPQVWLAFQMQVPDRERSKTVNNLLKAFLRVTDPKGEENEIIQEIEELQEKMNHLNKELANKSAELQAIKTRKIREWKEFEEKAEGFEELGMLRRTIK